MKKFFIWLTVITLTIALVLPFVLGRLLAEAYPSLLQQTLGQPDSPARLDQLDFSAGWFSSDARWLLRVGNQTLELNDHLRHFPLQEKAVLDGKLQSPSLPLELSYRLGLDRNIHLNGRLLPGQQGLAIWKNGQWQAELNPEIWTGHANGKLELLLLPGAQAKNLHFAGQWQGPQWQWAVGADTWAQGPLQWKNALLGLEHHDQQLRFKGKSDQMLFQHTGCKDVKLAGMLLPGQPAYWARLLPLLGPMQQLDWLRFASETLPELLMANPAIHIESATLDCGDNQPLRLQLELQLLHMPPGQILQPTAWLNHLQARGWLEATPERLQRMGLPAEMAQTGRVDFQLANGLLSANGQTLPLQTLLPGVQP